MPKKPVKSATTIAKAPRTPKGTASPARNASSPRPTGRGRGASVTAGAKTASRAAGKHLVIVESPTKAKTINKYLGPDYVVMASVGHVRDLPSRAPKGVKQEVPGVDLEHDFAPTYEIMPDKRKTVAELKRVARSAADVWFATDSDREGEAIAWHLAQALDIPLPTAKRVVFNAITKAEIQHAFSSPRLIDESMVNSQQARRVLDRIVGYQVSPVLWKKVAGGLSAGRVQSVAVRLVVDREREIEGFFPEEYWKVSGYFAIDMTQAPQLAAAWRQWLVEAPADQPRTLKDRLAWLSQRQCLRAELVEVEGKAVEIKDRDQALRIAGTLGFHLDNLQEWQDPKGKGPARFLAIAHGRVENPPTFAIKSIETQRRTQRPAAPFITSTLQQAGSTRLGFPLQRTMRIAQQLYEGVDLKGMGGQTGLITYMRTDSTHLSGEALNMARGFIEQTYGSKYLPEKPNFFTSSNKAAQEAHEAIRPTDASLTPERIRSFLSEEQFKLYRIVWERFIACQMVSAEWDSTTVLIAARAAGDQAAAPDRGLFKTTGRSLVFDGFYKVSGIPGGGDEAILPPLKERQPLAPMQIDPMQHFTSPPPRYTEASLQKKLEEEGIGRPSTYAPIISTIQDRKYVLQLSQRDRRLYATDLGKVVTDKLVEGFPVIMDVAYTRSMELELDKIEEDKKDWVAMLRQFYGPFKKNVITALDTMTHAKAEMEPAPYQCPDCGAPTVYRFGKNGRFLSCSRYPECKYAAPIDREGVPLKAELTDIVCPVCGSGMTRRVGRFGPFLGCANYPTCKGIVRIDAKKGTIIPPKVPPLQTDLPCPKCGSPLALRRSKRGPWLSCSTYPKCRGRLAWSAVEPDKQALLEKQLAVHEAANPQPQIKTTDGRVVGDDYVPVVVDSGGNGNGNGQAVPAGAASNGNGNGSGAEEGE